MVRKMDSGYHLMVSQVLDIHAKSQKILSERDKGRVMELYQRAEGVQGSSDYNMFYNQCQKIFQLPSKIEFQSHKGDEVLVEGSLNVKICIVIYATSTISIISYDSLSLSITT